MDESGVSLVDIIPPWFPMLVYYLGYEQQARWWPQFCSACKNNMMMCNLEH
jgi:hypothetical protein